MPDDALGAQLVDLIDRAAEPVTLDEVRARDVAPRRARGRAAALIAVAAVLAVALATAAVLTRDDGSPESPAPLPVATTPTVTSVPPTGDPVDAFPKLPGTAIDTFHLPTDLQVSQAVAAFGSLWLTGYRSSCEAPCPNLYRVDVGVDTVEDIPGPTLDGLGIATGDGSLFVLSDRPDGSPYQVTRIDIPSYRVRYTVDVPDTHVYGNTNPIGRIVYGFGSVWVFDGGESIARLDATTGAQTARIELPPNTASNGLAVNAQGVWSVAWGGTSVSRIDPDTNTVAIVTNFAPGFAQSIAADDDYVWTTNVVRVLRLYRIEELQPELFNQQVSDVSTADVASGDGGVWFLGWVHGDKVDSPGNHPGLVGRIDPKTLAVTGVTELEIGALDEVKLAVGDGAAWVVDAATHRAWRIDAGR